MNEAQTMTTQTSETAVQGNPKRKRMLLILLAVILIVAALAFAWEQLFGRWSEHTDDAYIGGNVVQITPQTVGTVTSIGADDGDLVHEGQVLVQFDPSDAEIGLQQAEANLARTVRQVRGSTTAWMATRPRWRRRRSPCRRPGQTSTAVARPGWRDLPGGTGPRPRRPGFRAERPDQRRAAAQYQPRAGGRHCDRLPTLT